MNTDSDLNDTEGNKIVIENQNNRTIYDIISVFTKVSKAIGFNEHTIIKALLEEVDVIKDTIKENYIMSSDEDEESDVEDE